MTQLNAEALIQAISNAGSESAQLAALRQFKNCVIGHDDEKELFIRHGIIPLLLNIISQDSPSEIKQQALLILGSFAYGNQAVVTEMLQYPLVSTILDTIKEANLSESQQIITFSLRILATVFQAVGGGDGSGDTQMGAQCLEQHPEIVGIIDRLLSSPSTSLSAVQQCCKLIPLLGPKRKSPALNTLSQPLIVRVSMFLRSFQQSGKPVAALEPALAALAHVVSPEHARVLLSTSVANSSASGTLKVPVSTEKFLQGLTQLTRDEVPETRLAAVELLATLQFNATSPAQKEQILLPLLPALVPIMDFLPECPRVCLVLAEVCRDDVRSATMAVEVGLVKKIASLFKRVGIDNWQKSEIISAGLLALAGIGQHKDSFRQEIIDNGVLDLVIRVISITPDPDQEGTATAPSSLSAVRKIKIASCHLLRSLSRSVTLLRTSLASEEVVNGLMGMLTSEGGSNLAQDTEPEINEMRAAVMAALCNLILEFSPLQKTLLDRGLLDLIVQGAHSSYPPLRLNSMWALKHAIFNAPRELKDVALEKLTRPYLLELCNDDELEIQEQTMAFLRNLVCRNHEVVELLFREIGRDELFGLIEEKLSSPTARDQNPEVLVSTVYILVHIAAGPEAHRDVIAQRESLMKKLLPLMFHENSDLRVAIVWLVINLTWIEEEHGSASHTESCRDRADRIVSLGFEQALKARSQGDTLDFRERTKIALFQIDGLLRGSIGSR